MRIIYKLTILSLFYAISVLCCTNESLMHKTVIPLNILIKAQLDSLGQEIFLNIIKIYPAQKTCDQFEKYANLYICTKVDNGDTVFIFEECQKVKKIAFDTINSYPVLKNENIVIQSPDKVIVFVPSSFKIKRNVKYFYAKMEFYSEY